MEGSQITKVTGDVKINSTEGKIKLYNKKITVIWRNGKTFVLNQPTIGKAARMRVRFN